MTHKGSNYSQGDRVVYHPSKESHPQHTSVGTIDKVLQGSPSDQPRFIVVDESTKAEKVYGAEHIVGKK